MPLKKIVQSEMLLIAAGQNGDVYVGLEGDHYSDGNIVNWEGTSWNALDIEKSRVFGLEEELVHTLTILPIQHLQLYRAVNDLFGEKSRLSEHKMSFLLDFWSKPLLHKTWRQINRPLFNQEDEKLAVFIDELILIAESREEVFAKLLTVQSHPIWKNDQAFLRLSKRIAKDFISLQAPQLPIEMPDLDIYNAMLENPENLFHEHRFAFEIAVIWRDPSLAKNITRIYCSALKERKSLAVIVGKLHVRSLSRLLTQASLGRVNIVDNSFPE